MEKITIHTVEAWLLDYHEGNLHPDQVQELQQFLSQHPDLPVDPDFSGFPILSPPDIRMENKTDLYRSDFSVPEASEDDLECIAALEGDLDPKQQALFNDKVNSDPELALLFHRYQKARIHPDPDIRMENKDQLYRKTFKITGLFYTALATAAVLVIAFFLFKPGTTDLPSEQQSIAADSTREVIYLNKLVHPSTYDQIASAEPERKAAAMKKLPADAEPVFELEIRNDGEFVTALSSKKAWRVIGGDPEPQATMAMKNAQQASGPYLTIWAYSGELIRKNLLGQDPVEVKKNKFSLWEVADAGLERAADLFSIPADIHRQYNEEGDLVEVSFNSPLLAFSTPISTVRAQ